MTEETILKYISPKQLEYLKDFLDRENHQNSTNEKTRKVTRYRTNDLSLDDVILPQDAKEECYHLILKPTDHLNNVGMLFILLGELIDSNVVGGNWMYGAVVNGKVVPKPIEPKELLLLIKYRPSWEYNKWIPEKPKATTVKL